MDKPKLKNHRQIGQELELFFTNEIAPGAPFWLPKGMVIFKELERYIRELTQKAGYLETSTPIMIKSKLFKQSGHWEKFGKGGGNDMYNLSLWEEEEFLKIMKLLTQKIREVVKKEGKIESPTTISVEFGNEGGKEILDIPVQQIRIQGSNILINGVSLPVNYTLKPMNCPESTILYRFKSRSYKELPLRFSEIGKLHRREQAGELNGLLRVRQLTMDDAHIYVAENQIFNEISSILDMMVEFYKNFDFDFEFRLATRPEQRAGKDENWDKAERDLDEVLKKKNIKASDKKGDGAFYGPKIDMHIKDALSRDWQLATVQLDFHMPEAFKLAYVNKNGEEKRPVMIHRAIFGSFERFIAILTEHYQGAFPLWLSPVQVTIIPISDKHHEQAQKIANELKKSNIRVEVDDRAETMQAKIRDATLQKVPYLGIMGDREAENKTISVRTRDGKDLGQIEISQFIKKIKQEIDKKA